MINEKLYHSSDSPGYFYTADIAEEFDNLFLDLLSKHKDLPFDIFVVLRCLWKDSNWKTKGRFYIQKYDDLVKNSIAVSYPPNPNAKDELILGIDVVCFVEDFEPLRRNKVLQRLEFGKELFTFLADKFNKSAKKMPYLKLHKDALLSDIRNWCLANYWLKENENEPINFNVESWTLPKAELVFGKPFSKKVTDEMDKNIHLDKALTAIKYQNLVWNIDGNRQIEYWFYLSENKEWLCYWFETKSAQIR